jgi:hypothetical protein
VPVAIGQHVVRKVQGAAIGVHHHADMGLGSPHIL